MSWLQNDHYFFDQLHIRWLSLKKLKKFFSKFWRRTSIDHLTLSHIKVNIICGWNTFYKIFQKIFIKNFTKIFFLKFYWIFLIFSTQDGILMLIWKWHIFFFILWFLTTALLFELVTGQYWPSSQYKCKNQQNLHQRGQYKLKN